ncbi:hypothetical protein [Kineosporia sp. A_224]|uniref:hypothetical protein n=1 Tax=Kineosporia sp. A_224 TaxID=1962180 RepID=UPI000B4C205E|nr:hypothetical protein [Kineosporia sp. A_224]
MSRWAPAGPATGEVVAAAAVGAVVLGPALRPGYLLRYDLVSVPGPVLGDDALGLGDRLPRAVPWDAVVAVIARLLPDAVVTQVLALLALTAAGAGAARLARAAGPGRWVALLVAVWNPFVLEQLAIGHVPHLLGYAAVPWVAVGAHGLVTGRAGAWPTLAGACVAGSVTPGGGLLCVGTALAVVAAGAAGGALRRAPGRGGAGAAVLTALVTQLPWVVAGRLHPALAAPPAEAVDAFATRAETAAGVVVDVLGLGGLWAPGPLPASRTTSLALASTVVLLGLAAAGLPGLLRQVRQEEPRSGAVAGPGDRFPLVVAGAALVAAGYLVALLPHLPGGRDLLLLIARGVPGGGLLRDGHRWLAWPAVGVAVLAGFGAAALADSVGRRSRGAVPALPVLVLVASAVVAVAPDLALGLGGRLVPVTYPRDWARVRAALDAADARGGPDRVLVLPWQPFRRFAWSGPAPVLDPASRMLPRPALVDDALSVGGTRLPAEGAGARAVAAGLEDGVLTADELGRLGVGWVLVERGTPGRVPVLPAAPLVRTVVDGPDALLLRVAAQPAGTSSGPGPVLPAGPTDGRRRTVTAAHLIYGLVGVLAAVGQLRRGLRGAASRKR